MVDTSFIAKTASDMGLTLNENGIKQELEFRYVKNSMATEDMNRVSYCMQKKKGKDTKKVSCYVVSHDGHVEKVVYAYGCSEVEMRAALREAAGR